MIDLSGCRVILTQKTIEKNNNLTDIITLVVLITVSTSL